MKTIFDFNPTKKELTDLFGDPVLTSTDLSPRSQEDHYWLLCELFRHRGDEINLNKYLSKLPQQRQSDFLRFKDHLVNG